MKIKLVNRIKQINVNDGQAIDLSHDLINYLEELKEELVGMATEFTSVDSYANEIQCIVGNTIEELREEHNSKLINEIIKLINENAIKTEIAEDDIVETKEINLDGQSFEVIKVSEDSIKKTISK